MSLPTIRADVAQALTVLGLLASLLTVFVADASDGALHNVAHWASIALVVISIATTVLKDTESVLPTSAAPKYDSGGWISPRPVKRDPGGQ